SSGNYEFGRFRERRNTHRPGTAGRCTRNNCHNVQCSAQWVQSIASFEVSRTDKDQGESAMNDTVNRQVLLVEKPAGKLGPEHFKLTKGTVPEPKDGEVLLRTRYISLDAANRAWMHGATYRAAVEANTVMAGGSIAEVVSSKAPGFAPGDIPFGDTT